MKAALSIAFAVALTVYGQSASAINSFIHKQAQQEHGEEYEKARKTIAGDFNRDGIPDKAVLYTIEGQNGTNNYVQYLAVFLGTKTGLEAAAHVVVGGKGYRSVELKAAHGNTIELVTMSYGPHDPMCCPSLKGETTYVLAGQTLVEQKNQ